MALKQVQNVKVGSTVKVRGVDYKVSRNVIGNLVLNKIVGIAIDQRDVYLNDVIGATGPSTYVEVVSEPKADLTSQLRGQLGSTPNPGASVLTEKLRKQKAQQDLTESLRSQVEVDEDEEEDCDCEDCQADSYGYGDWDDEDDEDDEDDWDEDEDEEGNYEFSFDFESLGNPPPSAEQAITTATAANLRSQMAEKSARQAQLDAVVAKASVKGANAGVDYLAGKVEDAHDRLDVHQDAHNALADVVEREVFNQAITNDTLSAAQRESTQRVRDVEGRVSAIENKIKEEERKVNLQQQLNAKLAQKKATSDIQAQLNQKLNQKTTGGNGTMKKLLGNAFNFGKVEGKFALSLATGGGLALRKGISNDFVAYDKKTGSLTDVSGLTLKFDVPAFKLPTAEKDVKVGDIIIHNAEYVYVTKKADGYLEVINPEKAVRGSVIPTKNAILNAAFYTVVKTLDAAGEGGFNPMLLMAMGDGKKDDLLPLLLMSGGLGGAAKGGAIDPTMLMLLGDEVEDLLPLVLMQQSGAAGQGFNPLLFLATQKGGKLKELLPLLLMSGGLGQAGGQAGQFNPLLLMAMGDGGSDMKDLFLMQALTGQNIFGGAQAPKADAPKGE